MTNDDLTTEERRLLGGLGKLGGSPIPKDVMEKLIRLGFVEQKLGGPMETIKGKLELARR